MTSGKSMHYFIAPAGWDMNAPNPFTPDGRYGATWVAFVIGDLARASVDYDKEYGRLPDGLFRYSLDRTVAELEANLADFIRYGDAHGWNVILAFPSDIDAEAFVRRALEQTPDGPVVRETDPRWLVH